jgi:predicted nuclease of predicted toxin-antitoxin system
MSKSDLKFLVDAGVGKKVESFLFESGFDFKSIREIDHRMKDSEILRLANSESRIVITMDKDFGELIFNSGLSHYGVLLLRLDDSNGEEKVETIKEIITKYESSLSNNFCVYQNSRLRIKRG